MTVTLGLIQDPALLLRHCGFNVFRADPCMLEWYDRLCMLEVCDFGSSLTVGSIKVPYLIAVHLKLYANTPKRDFYAAQPLN